LLCHRIGQAISEKLAFVRHAWLYLGDLEEGPVPTLFRFLVVVAILAGIGFAAIFALATLVEPEPREISVPIPSSRLSTP